MAMLMLDWLVGVRALGANQLRVEQAQSTFGSGTGTGTGHVCAKLCFLSSMHDTGTHAASAQSAPTRNRHTHCQFDAHPTTPRSTSTSSSIIAYYTVHGDTTCLTRLHRH